MRFILSCLLLFAALFNKAFGLTIIHDAQTEKYLEDITNPLLIAAGYDPKEVNIYLIQDDTINAFVAEGKNIFVNTGLIQAASNQNVLEGVLAHEIGHIKGSHLIRHTIEAKNIIKGMAISFVTGLAVFAGAGGLGNISASDAVQGGIMAASNIADRKMLSSIRKSEQDADRTAVDILTKLNKPVDGLLELFEKLRLMEAKFKTNKQVIDEYSRTHPLTENRINYIKSFQRPFTPIPNYKHQLITAKLAGYFKNYENLQNDTGFLKNEIPSQYFKTYEKIRIGDYKQALELINKAIEADSNDGFLYETRATVNFSLNNLSEAIADYKKAQSIIGFEKNIELQLATTLIFYAQTPQNNPNKAKILDEALETLTDLHTKISDASFQSMVKRQIAMCYAQMGKQFYSDLYLAEYYVQIEQFPQAKALLEKLEKQIKNSKDYEGDKLRIEDMNGKIKEAK